LSNGVATLEFGSGTTPTVIPYPGFINLIRSGVSKMVAFDTSGTFTALTSHNEKGNAAHISFNIYTGKIMEIDLETGEKRITYDGIKVNPEVLAREEWIKRNWQTIEVSVQEALEEVEVDVEEDGLQIDRVVYELDTKSEAIRSRIDRTAGPKIKRKIKGKQLKANYEFDTANGKVLKRVPPTKTQVAVGFHFDWNTLPEFVRRVWKK
jgi:hypothetical protein